MYHVYNIIYIVTVPEWPLAPRAIRCHKIVTTGPGQPNPSPAHPQHSNPPATDPLQADSLFPTTAGR